MVVKVTDPTQRVSTRQQPLGGIDVDPSRAFGDVTTVVQQTPRVPDTAQYLMAKGKADAAVFDIVGEFVAEATNREILLRDSEEKERLEQRLLDYKLGLKTVDGKIAEQFADNPDFVPDEQDRYRTGQQHTLRTMALDGFDRESKAYQRLEQYIDNYNVEDLLNWKNTLNGRRADIAIEGIIQQYDKSFDLVTKYAEEGNVTGALEIYDGFVDLINTKGRIRLGATPEGMARLEEQADKLILQYVKVSARDDPFELERSIVAEEETLRGTLGDGLYQQIVAMAGRAAEARRKSDAAAIKQIGQLVKESSQKNYTYLKAGLDDVVAFEQIANLVGIDPSAYPLGFNQSFLNEIFQATDPRTGQLVLRPEEQIKLQDEFNRKEERNDIRAVSFERYNAALQHGYSLNKDDKSDIAAADVGYGIVKAFMDEKGVEENGQRVALVEAFRYTKIVPVRYQRETSGLINSEDPKSSATGLVRLAALYEADPILANSFKDEELAAALLFQRGAPLTRAAAVLKQEAVPKELIKLRNKEFDKLGDLDDFQNELDSMIEDRFDYKTGWTQWKTPLSMNDAPEAPPAMTHQFQEQSRIYYEMYGDEDVAKEMAMKDITNKWGRTDVMGNSQMMRLPPELLVGGDTTLVGPALYDDLKLFAEKLGVKEDGYFILSDNITEATPKNTLPSYSFYKIDSDGFISPVFIDPEDAERLELPAGAARWIPDVSEFNKTMQEHKEQANQDRKDYNNNAYWRAKNRRAEVEEIEKQEQRGVPYGP